MYIITLNIQKKEKNLFSETKKEYIQDKLNDFEAIMKVADPDFYWDFDLKSKKIKNKKLEYVYDWCFENNVPKKKKESFFIEQSTLEIKIHSEKLNNETQYVYHIHDAIRKILHPEYNVGVEIKLKKELTLIKKIKNKLINNR